MVVGGEDTCKELLETYHDALTAGHPGVLKTLRAMCKDYWWLGVWQFVQDYIRGCAKCQENKMNTHLNQPPLQPFPSNSQA